MKLYGKNAMALILIGCGALILIGKFGWAFGHLIGFLVPIVLIALGVLGWSNGRKFIGGVLVFLGAITLLGKLSGLIGLVAGILMIGYGVSTLTRKRSY